MLYLAASLRRDLRHRRERIVDTCAGTHPGEWANKHLQQLKG